MADAGRSPDLVDFNPDFAQRLAAFRNELDKEGVKYSMESGYRSPEYQGQMYQNHLDRQAGRPLTYPGVEAPKVVAPAWRSYHNYGIATDFGAADAATYARIRALAPQFGLSGIGTSDPGHIQMAGGLDQNIRQYNLANWRPSGQPAPDNATAYAAPPSTPTTITSRGTLASAGGNPFINSLSQLESGGQNIYSKVDKDYPGQPNSRSQGYNQIDVPTWLAFAPKAGVDTNQYPTPMSAKRDIQNLVASQIPISRFGTRDKLMAQYGRFDINKTVGELAQQYGGQGTTLTSPGPMDPSARAHGSTVNPAIPDAPGETTPVQNFWTKLNTPGPSTTDAKGNEVKGKTPLENITSGLGEMGGKKEGQQAAAEPQPAQFAPVPDPMAQMAGPAAQLYNTIQTQAARPLTWSTRPYGWEAGPQVPGTTLNSAGYG